MPTQTYGRFGTFLTSCAVVALIATLALTGLSVPHAPPSFGKGMTSLDLVMSMMTSLACESDDSLGRMSQAEVRVGSPLSISTPSTVRLMPGRVPRSSGWCRSLVIATCTWIWQ